MSGIGSKLSLLAVAAGLFGCSGGATATGGADAGQNGDARADSGRGGDTGSPEPDAGDSGAVNDSGGDDGGVDESGSDGGGACEACDCVPLLGNKVFEQRVAMAAPTPKGGSIPSGTYNMTAANVYTGVGGATGPTGNTFQETVVVQLPSFQRSGITTGAGGNGSVNDTGYFYFNGGTMLHFFFECPNTYQQFMGFDSDGKNVTLYPASTTGPVGALVFTKQ